MKRAFYGDITATQAAVTEVLKNIPIIIYNNIIKYNKILSSVLLSLMETILNK